MVTDSSRDQSHLGRFESPLNFWSRKQNQGCQLSALISCRRKHVISFMQKNCESISVPSHWIARNVCVCVSCYTARVGYTIRQETKQQTLKQIQTGHCSKDCMKVLWSMSQRLELKELVLATVCLFISVLAYLASTLKRLHQRSAVKISAFGAEAVSHSSVSIFS